MAWLQLWAGAVRLGWLTRGVQRMVQIARRVLASTHLQALEDGPVQLGNLGLGGAHGGGQLLGVTGYDDALCTPHLQTRHQVSSAWR